MAVGDLYQVTFNQILFSKPVQNTLYYRVETDATGIDNAIALANQFVSFVVPEWMDAVSQQLQTTCVQAQKVSPDPTGAAFDQFITSVGVRTGDALPGQSCGLIKKFNPAVGGKGKTGRVYIAGIAEPDADDGRLQAIILPALNSLGVALVADLLTAGTGVFQAVWLTRSATPPITITGFVDWPNFTVMPRIATQRRRRTPIVSFS